MICFINTLVSSACLTSNLSSNSIHILRNKTNYELDCGHGAPMKSQVGKKISIKGKSFLQPESRHGRASIRDGLPPKHPIIHFPFPAMRKDLLRSNVIVKPLQHLSSTNSLGC